MRTIRCNLPGGLLLLSLGILYSCQGQGSTAHSTRSLNVVETGHAADSQVAEYIRHIFEDKHGHLWLGTNSYGVAHYNGERLAYYSNEQGFAGEQITGITQDPQGNLWFATDQGVVRHAWSTTKDGEKIFTNYSEQHLFNGSGFWSIYADSKGVVWAGGGGRVYRFDGILWSVFELPYSDAHAKSGLLTDVTTWTVAEDRHGNIWFGTNGNGAIKYDGTSFVQYTTKDGLTDNQVDPILEDRHGNIWLGTRFGGLSMFDGQTFTNYTHHDSIGNNEVCVVYEDRLGNIWLSSEGYGVYRYDGRSFTNFFRDAGLGVRAVQAIYEDRDGRLWVGGGGGLYRREGDTFVNVTRKGPWGVMKNEK